MAKAKLDAAGEKADASLLAASTLADAKVTAFDETIDARKSAAKLKADASTKELKLYDEVIASAVISGNKVPSFDEWLPKYRRSGAVSISFGAREDIKAKKYFTSPKGLVADVDKYISSDEVQNQLIRHSDDPGKLDREKISMKEQYIRGKITGSGGDITGAKLEGRTFVFTVKWPDGTITEVRYAN